MSPNDATAIAMALDHLDDGSPIAGTSIVVQTSVIDFGGSPEAADLARAIVRLVIRATGNGNE